MGASLVGAGIKVEGDDTPLPRVAVMPRKAVTVDETWNTVGLSATGSHDAVVEDVVVDPSWTFIRGGAPAMDDMIFRFPAMALAAQVLAVVALGAAREALDFLVQDARQRASITGAPNPGARPYVQAEFAKAQGLLMGTRAAFYDTIEAAWAELKTNGEVSHDMKVRLRLVATKAARDGAEAARIAFVIGGSGVMNTGHTLSRCMIDAACVAQHAFMGEGTWTAAGAAFFEQPTMPGYP
jgi:alkylation response protein AidB-like acyl-CoA dehydrogenase